MGKKDEQKIQIDPRLPVVLQGLMAALPARKRLPGDRMVFHQAIKGLMHECRELQGIARFRGSGFSPEIHACLNDCPDITFSDGMMTISGSALGSVFARDAQELLDPETITVIRHHARALSGRIT